MTVNILFHFRLFNVSQLNVNYCLGIEEIKSEEPVTKDSAMEAEVKAAQQRAVIPLEDRIQQFKTMLAEKEVFRQADSV